MKRLMATEAMTKQPKRPERDSRKAEKKKEGSFLDLPSSTTDIMPSAPGPPPKKDLRGMREEELTDACFDIAAARRCGAVHV